VRYASIISLIMRKLEQMLAQNFGYVSELWFGWRKLDLPMIRELIYSKITKHRLSMLCRPAQVVSLMRGSSNEVCGVNLARPSLAES